MVRRQDFRVEADDEGEADCTDDDGCTREEVITDDCIVSRSS